MGRTLFSLNFHDLIQFFFFYGNCKKKKKGGITLNKILHNVSLNLQLKKYVFTLEILCGNICSKYVSTSTGGE